MEASLQTHAVRNLKKILQCISRFGEELHIQATSEGLQLATVNSSKTAFCLFSLSEISFAKYKLTGKASSRLDGIKCKLQVKSVLSVLGRSTLSQNIERLDLRIEDPSQGLRRSQKGQGRLVDNDEESEDDVRSTSREARLVLKLICKHGVIKTHSLNLASSPFLVASVEAATLTTRFVIPARTLRDWLDHFSASGNTTAKAGTDTNGGNNRQESELGWYFDPTQVRVKTWEGGQALKKGISTELKIDVSEFDEYTVSDVICLTFPMREFRAAISLAESWSIPLITEFSTAGQPLSLKLEVEGIVADLTIATTENEGFRELQAENVSSSNKPVKREVARPGVNGTVGQIGRAAGKTPMKKKNSLQFSRDAAANFPQAQAGREGADQDEVTITDHRQNINNDRNHSEEPLFFPGGSQEGGRPLSQAQMMQAASQRELDQMDPEELAGIFDDNDLDLDDNQNDESNDYDEATRPSKRPKSHSNAEELLGESLLNLGVQNENDDGDDDDDDEAPGTVPPAQEGSNSVSGLDCAGP